MSTAAPPLTIPEHYEPLVAKVLLNLAHQGQLTGEDRAAVLDRQARINQDFRRWLDKNPPPA